MLDWAQWKIETVDLCMQPYLSWRVELVYKASVTGFETSIDLYHLFLSIFPYNLLKLHVLPLGSLSLRLRRPG